MSNIKYIIVHCSYTPDNMDIGVETIDRWHREKGWMGCGYHAVIKRDGTVELGRPLDKNGAHVKGMNSSSKGICLIGGMNRSKDGPALNFTDEQYESLRDLIDQWKDWHWIIENVPLGILARPKSHLAPLSAKAAKIYASSRIPQRASHRLADGPTPRWCYVNMPLNHLSSTQLRGDA